MENSFRYNDAVLRNIVISQKQAITEPSHLAKADDRGEVPVLTGDAGDD